MISVIIPVYNTIDYIDQCVASVLAQTYTDLEILLIDDCSTDGSSEVLDRWKKQDQRVRVIHKPQNSGVSNSRNIALKEAKGEYIAFVDSDDWLEPDMYAEMIAQIEQSGAEIAIGGYNRIAGNQSELVLSRHDTGTILDRDGILLDCIPRRGKGRYNLFLWDKLYRRSALIENGDILLFDPDLDYAEDIAWFIRIVLKGPKAVIWKGIGYNYRITRPGNTWTAVSKHKSLKYCQDAVTANTAFAKQLHDIGSRAENNMYQRVLFYRMQLILTARALKDTSAIKQAEKGYLSDLIGWMRRDHSPIGIKWGIRQAASYLKAKLRK